MTWYIIAIGFFLLVLFIRLIRKRVQRAYERSKGVTRHWGMSPGERGEYYAARQLCRLDDSKYFVFNDLLIRKQNGLTCQIDHIVVCPSGVFVIETKNISGYIYGREKGQKWKRVWKAWWYGIEHSNQLEFDNPVLQNEAHIEALSERMGRGRQIPYYSVIAFSPEAELRVEVEHIPVIYWTQLRDIIRSHKDESLTIEEARSLYNEISALNITDPDVRSMHGQQANARKINYEQKTDTALDNGKCPKCGGNLVLREGAYSRFYGCSNYPNCKYTHPAY